MRAPPNPGEGARARPSTLLLARLTAALEASGKAIAGVCLVAMFLALLANVVLRYAFGSGIPWAYEIHAVLFPWLVAGGVVAASAQGRHIAVTLLPDALGARARTGLMLAIDLAVLTIALSVLWSSQPIIQASRFQRLSTLGIVQTWGYASLVYAFGGIAVLAALDALRLAQGGGTARGDPALQSLS